jgi:uncharacterized cupredoxin-like copper-binding protein
MLKRILALTAFSLLTSSSALSAVLVASPESHRAVDATTVRATMTEFKFVLSRTTVPLGKTYFRAINKGKLRHNFKLKAFTVRTPTLKPGQVNGQHFVTFTKRGKYQYLCTVAGHAAAGMKGVLTVK